MPTPVESPPRVTPEEKECIRASRREQLIEVGVFLFLVMPSVVISLLAVQRGALGFTTVASSVILRDLALVCLILFFVWHNNEPRSLIGWTAGDPSREVLLGTLLYLPMLMAEGAIELLLRQAGLTFPEAPPAFLLPRGGGEIVLGVLLVLVVAVAEETIFRGYLIRRFFSITGSIPAAVILSSLIFAVGHGYEGTAGLITVGFLGVFFALVYLWRGSLVAPMVLHFLQDFMAIVLGPLLQGAK